MAEAIDDIADLLRPVLDLAPTQGEAIFGIAWRTEHRSCHQVPPSAYAGHLNGYFRLIATIAESDLMYKMPLAESASLPLAL